MRTNILVEIKQEKDYFIGETLWNESFFLPNIKITKDNREDLIEALKYELTKILQSFGSDYIGRHSSDENFVRCPDAKVLLPIDSFYCKHDDTPCNLGGGIFKKNKENFIEKCRISTRKQGIWTAIETNRYNGFHHIPGRYLCPNCELKNSEKKRNYNYHYPWELCIIQKYLEVGDIELKKEIIRKLISRNIYYSNYCGNCTSETLNKLNFKINFEVFRLEVYRKVSD